MKEDYKHIKDEIRYWKDYNPKAKREITDRDCILNDGNLYADTLISLWTPLKLTLQYYDTPKWQKYSKISEESLKNDHAFLNNLLENFNDYFDSAKDNLFLLDKLEELMEIGQQKCNTIILPYRRWNTLKGRYPYQDYMPYFLYDMLKTEDKAFKDAVIDWIKRQKLEMFFDGSIEKENLKDLANDGSVTRRPANRYSDLPALICNYIDILNQRKELIQ